MLFSSVFQAFQPRSGDRSMTAATSLSKNHYSSEVPSSSTWQVNAVRSATSFKSNQPNPKGLSNDQLLQKGCSLMMACSFCKKSFPSKSCLKQHIIGMHGGPQFTCTCGKLFQWRKSFLRHQSKCEVFIQNGVQFLT